MLLVVPLIVAFTLRPAVYANADRLAIRNPLRLIVLPWGQVAGLRSGYSNEVLDQSGRKFQLWAVPVSLRGRKKAAQREARQAADASGKRRGGGGGLGASAASAEAPAVRHPDRPGRCVRRPTGSWTNCASCGRRGARRRVRRAR